ncbi:MAG: alpha/beta fold hydrolase [Hyphomicrobiaceae bacterium]
MATSIMIETAPSNSPWLVMVHGMSQDHRIFDEQVKAFSGRFRILLIDLPCHGLATDIDGPYGHVEYARHVHTEIRKHISTSVHYWGTHTGTAAALLIASAEPVIFKSLVLEGPVMPGQNVPAVVSETERAREIARSKGAPAAVEAWWSKACWFDYMKKSPKDCRANQHQTIIADFRAGPWIDRKAPAPVKDISGNLEQLSIPTLIYNGTYDHLDFLEQAERLVRILPQAQRWLAPNAGGFPAWERPDSVNERVGRFFYDVSQDRAERSSSVV